MPAEPIYCHALFVGYAYRGVSQKMTLRNLERLATEVIPYFEKCEAELRRATVG